MMNIDSALTLGLWDVWRQILLTNVTCILVRWDFKLFKMKLWKLILRIKLSKMKPMTLCFVSMLLHYGMFRNTSLENISYSSSDLSLILNHHCKLLIKWSSPTWRLRKVKKYSNFIYWPVHVMQRDNCNRWCSLWIDSAWFSWLTMVWDNVYPQHVCTFRKTLLLMVITVKFKTVFFFQWKSEKVPP